MKNLSISFKETHELESNTKLEAFNTPATLIQVFCGKSDVESVLHMQKYFSQKFSQACVIGTTTDGIINAKEVYSFNESVVTFTQFEKTTLQIVHIDKNETQSSDYMMGVSLASSLNQDNLKALICFTDGLSTNGEEFLKGVESLLPDVVLAGGMAADNGLLEETFIFTNNFLTSSGCVGVALNSLALHIDTRYSFDWTPIGIHLEVTKSVKNRVYEIEGMNVIDVYAKYFGHELASQLPNIGIEFPLIFEKDGVQIGRAVLAKHSDGSLTFAGNIEEGTKVRFGVGSVEKILQSSHYNIIKW